MRTILAVSLAALLVVACAPKRDDAVELRVDENVSAEGEADPTRIKTDEVDIQFGGDVVIEGVPKGAPIYAGAKPMTFSRLEGAAPNGQDLVIINLMSTDSATKVTEFYRAEMTAAGYTLDETLASADGGFLIGKGASDNDQLSVVVQRADGKTSIMISGSLPSK